MALNCCVIPCATEPFAGVTAMELRVGAAIPVHPPKMADKPPKARNTTVQSETRPIIKQPSISQE